MKMLNVLLFLFLSGLLFAQGNKDKQQPAEKMEDAGKEVVKLKWWINLPPSHPASVLNKKVVDKINAEAAGEISLDIFYGESLGTQGEAVNLMRSGSLAFFFNGPALLRDYDARLEVFTMPYVISSSEQLFKIWDDEGEAIFEPSRKKSGIRALGFWNLGFRNLTTEDIDVSTPDDLKGVKIRAIDYTMSINMVRSLGANAVPVPFSELYIALQTGVSSGQENPITTIYSNKYYEVQNKLFLTRHQLNATVMLVADKVWQQLSPRVQKIISDAFNNERETMDALNKENEAAYLEEMESKGLEVYNVDRDIFREHSLEYMLNIYGEQYGDFIKLLRGE